MVRDLPEWNIFRRLYERPEDIVVCFDILRTRQHILSCRSAGDLRKLSRKLIAITKQAIKVVQSASTRESRGVGGAMEYRDVLYLNEATRVLLMQDTIIICFDVHKAIRKGILKIDIDFLVWFQYISHVSHLVYDLLLSEGFLARGAIGCGTLSYSRNLILGSAFIDAYDRIEGDERLPMLAVEATPTYLRYQNWINCYLPHIHCSVAEFINSGIYIEHKRRV